MTAVWVGPHAVVLRSKSQSMVPKTRRNWRKSHGVLNRSWDVFPVSKRNIGSSSGNESEQGPTCRVAPASVRRTR